MDIKSFIENFIEAIELEDVSEITEKTVFKELEDWYSLSALATISMVDDEYGVTITNKDLRAVDTLEELFNLVASKK